MENKVDVVLENENKVYGPSVYIGCMPFPEQCIMPNYLDYPNDKRIKKLEKIFNNKCPRIYIIGGKHEEITQVYRDVLLLREKIEAEYSQEDDMIEITLPKKIFWFSDKLSCKIFEDIYGKEENPIIISYYDRIFESIAGNNLCITLYNAWGILDRLPLEMSICANRRTRQWREFK